MNPTEKAKITRFLDDVVLSGAVQKMIENAVLRPKGNRDVYYLAAERIALDVLREAWKDLERCRDDTGTQEEGGKNVGL